MLHVRIVNDEAKTAEFSSNVVRVHIVMEEVERERATLMKVKQYTIMIVAKYTIMIVAKPSTTSELRPILNANLIDTI